MATGTAGSASTTRLTALVVSGAMSDADVATIMAAIKGDAGNANSPIGAGYLMPGSFNHSGTLYIPGRGILQCQPGDYVCVAPTTGWPILISSAAAAVSADWVHS